MKELFRKKKIALHCGRFYIDFHNINFAQFCHCNCSLILGIILVYMKLDGKKTSAFFSQYWGYIWSQLGFPWPRDRHPESVHDRLITPYKFSVNLSQLGKKFSKSKKKFKKVVLKNGCSIKLFLKPFSSDQSDIGWCIHLKNDSTSFICTFFW